MRFTDPGRQRSAVLFGFPASELLEGEVPITGSRGMTPAAFVVPKQAATAEARSNNNTTRTFER
jgi:hypothetical protein